MSKADAAAAILWVGATVYALFGGADFGGGFWDLIAGDAETGERPRALIQRSLTPVWEAKHVWLIFILVVLWTAFPPAFRAIFTTLYAPIALAALGIVLRGAGFAFRKSIEGLSGRRAAGATFALSSLRPPVLIGCRGRGGCSSPPAPPSPRSSSSATPGGRERRTSSATSCGGPWPRRLWPGSRRASGRSGPPPQAAHASAR